MMKADSSCEDFEDCSPLSQFMAVALMLGCHIKNGDITALLHHDISKGCIHDEITLCVQIKGTKYPIK